MRLYWLLYHEQDKGITLNIQNQLAKFIKERIEENLKGNYVSMIKLFLNLYSGRLAKNKGKEENEIIRYIVSQFKKNIAPRFMKDKDFREEHMPQEWKIKGKTIVNHGNQEIFTLSSKK